MGILVRLAGLVVLAISLASLSGQIGNAAGSGVFVTVFCDAADKYLSEEFWTD